MGTLFRGVGSRTSLSVPVFDNSGGRGRIRSGENADVCSPRERPSMGATSWRSYTRYRPDPEAALQALRAEVFARGDYVDPTGSTGDVLRQTFRRTGLDPDAPDARRIIESTLRVERAVETGDTRGLPAGDRAFVRRARAFTAFAARLGAKPPVRPPGRPRTVAELLERAAE